MRVLHARMHRAGVAAFPRFSITCSSVCLAPQDTPEDIKASDACLMGVDTLLSCILVHIRDEDKLTIYILYVVSPPADRRRAPVAPKRLFGEVKMVFRKVFSDCYLRV